jgi:hypothetical protein
MRDIIFWALVTISFGSGLWGLSYGDCSREAGQWVLFGLGAAFISLSYALAEGFFFDVCKNSDKNGE